MPADAKGRQHDWLVEEREYRRHEERRGRRHAYEHLDPPRTALVVVDVVPFFVEQSAYCRGILPQVDVLARGLRQAGGVVAWVVPAYVEPTVRAREFYGNDVAEAYAASGGTGAPAERLWRGLKVDPADLVVEKTAPSAFFPGRCDLHDLLQARGVDTLLVCGTVTNVCVESTVRDASTLDYRVVLVADACAAPRDRDHNATLHVVHRSFGDVRSTAEVLDLIGRGSLRVRSGPCVP